MRNVNDSDIENLNSKIIYSQQEKEKVRKDFLIVLIILSLLIMGLVVYFVYREEIVKFFKGKSSNKTNDNPIVEEIKDKRLFEMDDGDISIENLEIKDMFNTFYSNVYDYLLIDTSKIYKNNFSSLSDKEKLFYVAKTSSFINLIDNGEPINNKESLCDKNIIISSQDIANIAHKKFNQSNINHTDFIMAYYNNYSHVAYIVFRYSNDQYIGTCIDENNIKINIQVIARNILISAEKKDNDIYIYTKAIFETENGLYEDINLRNKIASYYDSTQSLDYFEKGSLYRLEFKYDGDEDYYFEKMTLVK